MDHDFSYNTNTNTNTNTNINTNTNTNNDISLTFINDSSLIIMEALKPNIYDNNITFGIESSRQRNTNFNYYIINTPEIISNRPNIYKIYFTYYDNSLNNGYIEYDLSIINTKLPEISFNNINDLYNIENNIQTNQDFSLIIPLLHNDNSINIESFEDLTRNQQYFTRKKFNKNTDNTLYTDTSINLTEIILNNNNNYNYNTNYILYNDNYSSYSQDISFIFTNDLSKSDISEIYFSLIPNPNIVNTISASDFSFNKSITDTSININIEIIKSYDSIDLSYSILYNISNKEISSFFTISNETHDSIINKNNTIELSYDFINGTLNSSKYDVSTNQNINIRFIDFNKYKDISDINIDISGNERFTLDRNDNSNNIIFSDSSFSIDNLIDLSYTINYKIRNENKKPNIFKEEKEQEIYSIPGVNFDDIVDGSFFTTIDELIDISFALKYNFSISYELIKEISGILQATKYPLLNETELSFNHDTSYISNRELFTRHLLTNDATDISRNREYIYKQIYNLFDLSLEKGISFERIIKLKKVVGYFDLCDTNISDICNNTYVEQIYHKKNEYYIDYGGNFKSFEKSSTYVGNIITRNTIDNVFNVDNIGKQNFNYKIASQVKEQSVHVIDIKNFPKENNNFITDLSRNIINHHITNTNIINNLKTNTSSLAGVNNITFIDSNIKYGLHKNNYNIDLISSIDSIDSIDISYYIRIFQYDYLKQEIKYANDQIDLQSSSFYNDEYSNYKDGSSIILTVSGDFLKSSLELLMINKSNPSDISSIIYKDLFIYDEKSKFINVQPIKKLDDTDNTYLDNSYNNLYEENIIVKVEKTFLNKANTINLNDNIYNNQNFQSNYILNNIGSSQNIKFIFNIGQSDISEIYFSLQPNIENSIRAPDFSFNKSNPDTSINIDISIDASYNNIDLCYSILYNISNKKIDNFFTISNETTNSIINNTIELSYNFINGTLTSLNNTYDVSLNHLINIRFIDFNEYEDISDITLDICNNNFTLNTINDNKDISFSNSSFSIDNSFDLSYTINYKIRNQHTKPNIFKYREDNINDDKKIYKFILQDGNVNSNLLHLCNGKYIFDQSNASNFLNPIYFSYIEDGVHNVSYNWIDFEYTKNIKRIKIPGQSGAKTIIYLDATTPSPLYFYNKNIPNNGGKIITKNNIILSKDFISLNSPVITYDLDNSAVYPNLQSFNNNLDNKIILSYNNYQSNQGIINKNICCLTMKNLYNNIIYNKNSNLPDTADKIIFLTKEKKQQLITNISNNIIISGDIEEDMNNYNYIFDTGNTSKSLNKIKLHKYKNVENIRDISNNLFFKYIDETRNNTNSLQNKIVSISDDVLDSIDNYKGYNIMGSTIFYYKNINFDNCSNIIEYFNIANNNHNDIDFNNYDNPYYIDNSLNSNLRERFFNINDIFNTNELNNYAPYFNKNLFNYNNKLNEKNINNTLLDIKTDASDMKIFNNNDEIERLGLNNMNLSNRFKFDFDPIKNIIIFFNQLYLDISDLNITTLNTDINKDNNLYNKNLIDNNKKYFTEITSIYKHFKLDISSVIIKPIHGIFFDKKTIELYGTILDSSNNQNRIMSNILYSLYNNLNPVSNEASYNIIDNELNNRIFLSIKDNINSNNSNLIGLTEGNFNNNITVRDDFIYFSQFNENNYINYQVNNNDLSLNYVLQNDISYSNNRFLIDNSINKNDYNCLPSSGVDNLLNDLSNELQIDYYIENEISENNIVIRNISNNYLIKPIYLNNSEDSSYGTIINADNTYNIVLNNLHSHSSIIDLDNFINRNTIGTNINFYNPNNLKYIIKDLSYNNNFNLIDLNEEEFSKDIGINDIKKTKNIMYERTLLYDFLDLHSKITILIYKSKYINDVYNFLNSYSIEKINSNNLYNKNQYSIKDLHYFYNNIALNISNNETTFTYDFNINTFNNLFILFNNDYKILLEQYNKINNNYNFILDLSFSINYGLFNNSINNIYQSYIVDELSKNIINIDINLNNVLSYTNSYYGTNVNSKNYRYNDISYGGITDFSYAIQALNRFYELENYSNLIYDELIDTSNSKITLNQRDNLKSNIDISKNYQDLYFEYDYSNFVIKLKDNYEKLRGNLIQYIDKYYDLNNDISLTLYSNNNTTDISNNIFDINNINDINNKSKILYNTLISDTSSVLNLLQNKDNSFINIDISNYIVNKKKNTIFSNFEYVLNNTTLLINSYKSNSIQLNVDIKYDSYLYNNETINTLVFDIMVPDLQPPGIKIDDNITLVAEDLSNNNYNAIINSIQYIEHNNDISLIEISFNTLDLIKPDGSENSNINISFILKDNANNKNILSHKYKITFIAVYKLYYYDRLNNFQDLDNTLTIDFNSLNITNSSTFNNKLQQFMNDNNNSKTIPFIGIFKNPNISNLDSSGNYPNDFSFNNISPYSDDYSDNITIQMNYNTDILSNSEFNLPQTITIKNVSTAIDPDVPVEDINTHCCYKKIYYKEFVDNYKQGSSATSTMRMTKFIINRHR